MATINKDLAEKIIAQDGYFENDPRVLKVVEYDNMWGGKSYGIIYPEDSPDRYEETQYVRNPKTLWEAK